jgi:hypothetical protein
MRRYAYWTLDPASGNLWLGQDDQPEVTASAEHAAFVVAYLETAARTGTDYATAVTVMRLLGTDQKVLDAGESGCLAANLNDARYDATFAEATEAYHHHQNAWGWDPQATDSKDA